MFLLARILLHAGTVFVLDRSCPSKHLWVGWETNMFHRASLDVMFGRGGMAAVRVAAQPCFLPSLRAVQTSRHGAVFGSWESHGGDAVCCPCEGRGGRQAGVCLSHPLLPERLLGRCRRMQPGARLSLKASPA